MIADLFQQQLIVVYTFFINWNTLLFRLNFSMVNYLHLRVHIGLHIKKLQAVDGSKLLNKVF